MKRSNLTTTFGSISLVLLAAGCANMGGSTSASLDDGLLQFVDAAAKQEVQEARVAHLQAIDERAAADYRVEHADGNRPVLVAEKRAAQEKVKLERTRVKALTDIESGTEAPPEAHESLAVANRELQSAERRIQLHDAQIEVLKAELNLAKAEEAHAAAVVDVWKARALSSLNNEDSTKIDIFEFESIEHDCGTEIEISKIRLWSAQSKVQTLEGRIDDIE